MINILFYGNCQLDAIYRTLNLSSLEYNSNVISCWDTIIDKDTFTDIIKKSDIIITQYINDNYRDVNYYSTTYILNNIKKTCKVIIIDSCYFDFYYFDLTYKNINGNILHDPIDYHYKGMLECYKNGNSIENYIDEYVNNIDLKTDIELDRIAENSLNQLYEKNIKVKYNLKDYSNIFYVNTRIYIKNNYKNKLLFYSMNHPSKYLIQFISEEISKILDIKFDIDYINDYLSNPKCIIYKCIQKNVYFDINDCEILTLSNNNLHGICKLYFDTYKKINI